MSDRTGEADRVVFLVGGARSGKSRLAVAMAESDPEVLFLATARPADEEMRERVARHRRERPDHWETVEEPLALASTIRRRVGDGQTVILDCLTLWVSNLLAELPDSSTSDEGVDPEEAVLARTEGLLSAMGENGHRWIVVSNEVGTGLHPDTSLGRTYRDLLGLVNQRVASAADRAYFLVAGQALELSEPPDVVDR